MEFSGAWSAANSNRYSNVAPGTGEAGQQQTTGGAGEMGLQQSRGRDFCGFLGSTKFWRDIVSLWVKCGPAGDGRGAGEARPTPPGFRYAGFERS